jgi:Zn finger protein HypA/HybF involved in hydrogenase expression
MHEMSLMESVLEIVEEEARRAGATKVDRKSVV